MPSFEYWEPTELKARLNDLNSISFTVSGVNTIITAITGNTGAQNFAKSGLNKILNSINFLNADPKRKSSGLSDSTKSYKKIINGIVKRLKVVETESSVLETRNNPNKIADRTALLNIDPNTLTDGETKYVANEDIFYSFNRSNTSGFSPATDATTSPGTWNMVLNNQVKVSLTTAQLKTAYSVPIDAGIAAPGAGKAIIVTSLAVDYTVGLVDSGEEGLQPDPFNFTKGNIRLQISGASSTGSGTQAATDDPGGGNGILKYNNFGNKFQLGTQNLGASTSNIFPNRILHITTDSDATSGSGSAIVYFTYYLLDL